MRFWEMIGSDSSLGPEITGTYTPVLVIVSILIAALAAYSALGVVERMSSSRKGTARLLWHGIGAAAMGCGIWSMHFTAMLALSLPVAVSYDLLLTGLSVTPAIAGSACALHFMARKTVGIWQLQIGALLMAVGIGLMHYTGMDAMRMEAAMRYDTTLFAVSILVAHVLATVTFFIRFKIVNMVRNRTSTTLFGGLAMGCTVSAMHYTAMAAAHYYDTGSESAMHYTAMAAAHYYDTGSESAAIATGLSVTGLATIIGILITLFLGLTIIGVIIDRRMEAMNKSLQASEARRQLILETMVDGLLTIDSTGIIDSLNPSAGQMLGYEPDQLIGMRMHQSVVRNPPPGGDADWPKNSPIHATLQNGTVSRVDSDKFFRQDGSSVPVEYISTPMYEEGRQIGAVITFRDITQRKQVEEERNELHRQLVDASRRAGQAEIATGVLHNVGNVLNSVTVSATLVSEMIQKSKSANLAKASQLLQENADDLGTFLTQNEKGRQLPAYLNNLAGHLAAERDEMLGEFKSIDENISHIKEIVARQQSFATCSGVTQAVVMADLLEDAMSMNVGERHGIELIRDYEDVPPATIDKHKALQIIVNLLRNAKQSVNENRSEGKQITMKIRRVEPATMRVEVVDNGAGIPEENIARVFEYGFTTRKDGRGFGLHASANAATEMGGTLTCHSDGPGTGATFVLELPLAMAAEEAA